MRFLHALRLVEMTREGVNGINHNKKHAGPLMGRAYLFNRATGGAVASLP